MEAETFIPLLTMIVVELGYAINMILSKLAISSGMTPFILVAYRQIFATATLVPLAYCMERKIRPKMTGHILFQIFLCSLLGISMTQITIFIGLKHTTPTIAAALISTNPAITFILALFFRLEKLRLKSEVGLAKTLGTTICVGGALLLTLYHGPTLGVGPSPIHWRYAERIGANSSSNNSHENMLLGPLMLIISATAAALWLIVQAKVNKMYAAPYSIQALMSLMGSIQCTVVALCTSRSASDWSLASPIRLVSALISGIICSALNMCAMSWCVNKKGPVYVAVFNPMMLIFAAIFSWGLLEEKWYLGKVLGSVLIILGLYGVIWAKKGEMMMMVMSNKLRDNNTEEDDEVERTRHENSNV